MPKAGRLGAAVLGCAFVIAASFALEHSSTAQIIPTPTYPPPPPTPTPTYAPTATPTATATATPTKTPKKTPKPTKTPKPKSQCAQTGSGPGNNFKSKSSFHANDSISVRGGKACAKAGVQVNVVFDPSGANRSLGSTRSGSNGSYFVQGTIPRGAKPGQHVIQARTGGHRYSATIQVVARTKRSPAAFLTSPTGLVGLGILLALLAFAFVLAPRRRRLASSMATGGTTTVPAIDTSGFVPFLEREPRKSSPRKRSTKRRPPAEES